jgi:hypothetical protein
MKMVGHEKDGTIHEEFWQREPDLAKVREYLQFPIAFYPTSAGNIRIATQKGCFTIHGTDRRPIESFFAASDIRKYLIKVKINKESVRSIRQQLRLIGVTARSVFPDLAGFANELSGSEYMRPC